MRVFLTGSTGFAGSHLLDQLLADGHEVYGLIHSASSILPPSDHENFHAVLGDMMDADAMRTMIGDLKPDVIYHLAGQASPGMSWKKAAFTMRINIEGPINILEAAVAAGNKPRVVIVTSAEIYGKRSERQLPISEKSKAAPRHPYGVSKLAAAQLVPLYWQRHQLPVIEARPFNHIGPRQALGFVVSDFSSQVAEIKLGLKKPTMMVGNLSSQRDFTDVRDVVRAYRLLAEKGQPGEGYIVCSGQPVAIQNILNILLRNIDLPVEVLYDPARMRPSDTPVIYGSFAKIKDHVGWTPDIHLHDSLADTMAFWEIEKAKPTNDN